MTATLAHNIRSLLIVTLALAVTTVAVGLVQQGTPITDASDLYFIALLAVAITIGSWPAVVVAVGAFLSYDFFFEPPLLELGAGNPAEYLRLVLLLLVAVVVGQLAALQRRRSEEACSRSAGRSRRVRPPIPRCRLWRGSRNREIGGPVWITLGHDDDPGLLVADTAHGFALALPEKVAVARPTGVGRA